MPRRHSARVAHRPPKFSFAGVPILLRNQHGGTLEPSCTKISQRLIGLPERVCGGSRDDAGPWRKAQKIKTVLPREVGNGDQLPFLPECAVRKTGNVAHVNPRTDNPTSLADRV